MITGIRHSGTTYGMRLLEACGLEGGERRHQENERQGEEWQRWRELGTQIGRDLGRSSAPVRPRWTEIDRSSIIRVRAKYEEILRNLAWPEIVKFPDMGWSALLDVIGPRVVVVMERDPKSWLGSFKGNRHARENLTDRELLEGREILYEQLYGFLQEYELEHLTMYFPRAAKDVIHAHEVCSGVLEAVGRRSVDFERFEELHDRVTHTGWVGKTQSEIAPMPTRRRRLRNRFRRMTGWEPER